MHKGSAREPSSTTSRASLPETTWAEGASSVARPAAWPVVARTAAFAIAIAAGARVEASLPGTDVPQSAQTLVLCAGALRLRPREALSGAIQYVAFGVAGLPWFAGGAAGLQTLLGPTGGYLLGFVAAAVVVAALAEQGRARRFGWRRSLPLSFLFAAIGHAIVLGLGAARLVAFVGATDAWERGVAPFLVGGVVKSAFAAVFATAIGVGLQRASDARDRGAAAPRASRSVDRPRASDGGTEE